MVEIPFLSFTAIFSARAGTAFSSVRCQVPAAFLGHFTRLDSCHKLSEGQTQAELSWLLNSSSSQACPFLYRAFSLEEFSQLPSQPGLYTDRYFRVRSSFV